MALKHTIGSAMLSPDLQRARDLVLRWGWNAMAYQILNPGMRLWFSRDGEGVAGYVRAAHYRVVAGAPVCPPERLPEIAAASPTTSMVLQRPDCRRFWLAFATAWIARE